MKKIAFTLLFLIVYFSGYTQTYQSITSKNKTYLATLAGVTYTYKNGIITVKNGGQYHLGTISVIASSKADTSLFGIALFDEGLKKGETSQAKVYFTSGLGTNSHEIPLNQIDQKSLGFSFDKAIRAPL